MKTIKYYFPVLTCLLLVGMLNAQVVSDPVKKVYKIGGSSEIFISYTNKDGTDAKHGILDVPPILNDITSVEEPLLTGYMDKRKTAPL